MSGPPWEISYHKMTEAETNKPPSEDGDLYG